MHFDQGLLSQLTESLDTIEFIGEDHYQVVWLNWLVWIVTIHLTRNTNFLMVRLIHVYTRLLSKLSLIIDLYQIIS